MSVTKKEEHRLAVLFQKTKDSRIIDFLLKEHSGFIWQTVHKVNKSFRASVPLTDLYQAAVEGFIMGVNRFDPQKDTRLLTYVYFWMMSTLFDCYSDAMPIHVPAHILRNMAWRTDKQRAEEINRTHDKIAHMLQLQRSTDESVCDDVIMKHLSFRNSSDDTYQQYERYALSEDISKIFFSLDPQTRKLLALVGSGRTRVEIAEIMDMSPASCELLLRSVRRKLRRMPAIQRAA